jgi:hypothetical protein
LPAEVRALADKNFKLLEANPSHWFWIGTHSEYDRLVDA